MTHEEAINACVQMGANMGMVELEVFVESV